MTEKNIRMVLFLIFASFLIVLLVGCTAIESDMGTVQQALETESRTETTMQDIDFEKAIDNIETESMEMAERILEEFNQEQDDYLDTDEFRSRDLFAKAEKIIEINICEASFNNILSAMSIAEELMLLGHEEIAYNVIDWVKRAYIELAAQILISDSSSISLGEVDIQDLFDRGWQMDTPEQELGFAIRTKLAEFAQRIDVDSVYQDGMETDLDVGGRIMNYGYLTSSCVSFWDISFDISHNEDHKYHIEKWTISGTFDDFLFYKYNPVMGFSPPGRDRNTYANFKDRGCLMLAEYTDEHGNLFYCEVVKIAGKLNLATSSRYDAAVKHAWDDRIFFRLTIDSKNTDMTIKWGKCEDAKDDPMTFPINLRGGMPGLDSVSRASAIVIDARKFMMQESFTETAILSEPGEWGARELTINYHFIPKRRIQITDLTT